MNVIVSFTYISESFLLYVRVKLVVIESVFKLSVFVLPTVSAVLGIDAVNVYSPFCVNLSCSVCELFSPAVNVLYVSIVPSGCLTVSIRLFTCS